MMVESMSAMNSRLRRPDAGDLVRLDQPVDGAWT
jgi:hypothetical protein